MLALAEPTIPVTGAGNTGAYYAVEQWASAVRGDGTVVNYIANGSHAGLSQFAGDLLDFAVTDVPYETAPERAYTYVPLVGDAVDFTFRLTVGGRALTDLNLSQETVAGIFTGTITRWDDPALTADNPGVRLPAEPIRPVVRADGNGTTLAFTSWLATRQPDPWKYPAGELFPYVGGNFVALSGALNTAGYTQNTEGAIAYVDHHTTPALRLPVARIRNAAGLWTAPTATSIAIGLTRAEPAVDRAPDLRPAFDNTDPRAYPLPMYHYLVVPTATSSRFTALRGKTLTRFAGYAICTGQTWMDALGYGPIPRNLTAAAVEQLRRVPGADPAALDLSTCANPTFRPDGTTILDTAPYPSSPGTAEILTTTVTPGTLTVSVEPGEVVLPSPALTPDGERLTTSGDLRTVTVTDTRTGAPRWNLSGQLTDFTDGAAHTIPAAGLTWAPTLISQLPSQQVAAGPTATLDRPAVLGTGDVGTARLGAHLTLNVPTSTLPGTYSAVLTFTAI